MRCGLIAPTSTNELADVLALASRAGRRITFRGGGCSFDTQSLNRDLVISLDRLRGLWFSADATRVEVGAGEPWGEVVRAPPTPRPYPAGGGDHRARQRHRHDLGQLRVALDLAPRPGQRSHPRRRAGHKHS